MDPKAQSAAAANRVYEDFVPPSDWSRNEANDKLVVVLPGFRKEQLKIQVTSNNALRISGERPLRDNIWSRFTKEFPLSSESNTEGISARFEGVRLTVMVPKMIPKAEPPTMEAPTQKTDQKVPSSPRKDKETEPADAKETQKKMRTSELDEGSISKPSEVQRGKILRRLKTRVVDFTQSVKPSGDKEEEEALGDLDKGSWKLKNLINLIVATVLLVLVLGLFAKNIIKSAP
ncbi:hypothetical protein L6164_029144 [Bauhinia variegata]|uniref:Uncharacterized protein n=1 Tax=Bauhinia variegata TaxID=167791 RepID=A0ACB9L7S0_BAUVA|nr:hypothetical protein L6164_029144 [Bauhinia variegata]